MRKRCLPSETTFLLCLIFRIKLHRIVINTLKIFRKIFKYSGRLPIIFPSALPVPTACRVPVKYELVVGWPRSRLDLAWPAAAAARSDSCSIITRSYCATVYMQLQQCNKAGHSALLTLNPAHLGPLNPLFSASSSALWQQFQGIQVASSESGNVEK